MTALDLHIVSSLRDHDIQEAVVSQRAVRWIGGRGTVCPRSGRVRVCGHARVCASKPRFNGISASTHFGSVGKEERRAL